MSKIQKYIHVCGARENNLKNIDIDIPLNKIVGFYGPSGSGKSSLVFKTIFNESKRKFINSLPNSVGFYEKKLTPSDVDSVSPILPAFALSQYNPFKSSRPTTIDVIDIINSITKLFVDIGKWKCPIHDIDLKKSNLLENNKFLKDIGPEKIIYITIDNNELLKSKFIPSKSIINNEIIDFDKSAKEHVLIRFKASRINDIEDILKKEGVHTLKHLYLGNKQQVDRYDLKQSEELICPKCDHQMPESFNASILNPLTAAGACKKCKGFGTVKEPNIDALIDFHKTFDEGAAKFLAYKKFNSLSTSFYNALKKQKVPLNKNLEEYREVLHTLLIEGCTGFKGVMPTVKRLETKKYRAPVRIFLNRIMHEVDCIECGGTRLNKAYHELFIDGESSFSLKEFYLNSFEDNLLLISSKNIIPHFAERELIKIKKVLQIVCDLGLGYLKFNQKAKNLTSSEFQRLSLTKYLSYDGTDALFIFDEVTLGIENNIVEKVFYYLNELISQGNSIIISDHSQYVLEKCDYTFKIGPASGQEGGRVVGEGIFKRTAPDTKLNIKSLNRSNKKELNFKVSDISFTINKTSLYRCNESSFELLLSNVGKLKLQNHYKDVVDVGIFQTKFSSRSTIGSILGIYPVLRKKFVQMANKEGVFLKEGHFSNNSNLGRCHKCEGAGKKIISMQFLEDLEVTCDECIGSGIQAKYLNYNIEGQNIHQISQKSLKELKNHLTLTAKFQRIFDYLALFNLDYLSLSRSIQSLSGGEKNRIYLLSKLLENQGSKLILLEYLSFGLSDEDFIRSLNFIDEYIVHTDSTFIILDNNPLLKDASIPIKISNT